MPIKVIPILLLLLSKTLFTGCHSLSTGQKNEPQRYVWVTGLKPGEADYYEKLHVTNPWRDFSEQITQSNIRNFSIHKREIQGKLYLIVYLEYIGDDFKADMAEMAENEATQCWWAETDPTQIALPDVAAKGLIWADTEEFFIRSKEEALLRV